MQRTKGYYVFLAFTVLAALSAVVTLVPHGAGKVSFLGYQSMCPFAPVSTLICLALAGSSCVLRGRFFKG